MKELKDYKYWNYPNFSIQEMRCKCGECDGLPVVEFMDILQSIRTKAGFPFTITSGYRCPKYNKRIGGGPTHPKGLAADIGIYGSRAFEVVKLASNEGITGIGISQTGNIGNRFIHLDIANSGIIKGIYRPTIWSY